MEGQVLQKTKINPTKPQGQDQPKTEQQAYDELINELDIQNSKIEKFINTGEKDFCWTK